MATDMQRLSLGFPSQQALGRQDARDRQPAVQGIEPSRNFESMLGRAEARQTPSTHHASTVRNGGKPGNPAGPAAYSSQDSARQPSERSTVTEAHERNMDRGECTGQQTKPARGESPDKDATQDSKTKNNNQEALPQEILLAAMIAPNAPTTAVEAQPVQADTNAAHSDDAVTAVATIPTDRAVEGSTPTTSMAAPISASDAASQGIPAREGTATTEPGNEATQAKDRAGQPVPAEGKDIPASGGQIPASEGQTAVRAEAGTEVHRSPDQLNPALSAMPVAKQDSKTVNQEPIDHADRSMVLEALAQGTSLSEGQAGAGAGGFTEHDGRSFSDSAGTDRSLSSQTLSLEQNARPGFLDRMNGLNQPAPSVNESASNRSESGQTASVLRASESERMQELRGAVPVSQSVTLDLDPLDMGPLRVRVMMSDQTVHAHIRTEHGELGQGLLQQGQSLESSLRTTGLEMGMLRVTIDQQQGRGDNAWMFQQQQQQGRPPSTNLSQPAAPEERRAPSGERVVASDERVSLFA